MEGRKRKRESEYITIANIIGRKFFEGQFASIPNKHNTVIQVSLPEFYSSGLLGVEGSIGAILCCLGCPQPHYVVQVVTSNS